MNSIEKPITAAQQFPREIILIDDEPSVLFALRLLLQALGYNVRDFGAPDIALEYLKTKAIGDPLAEDLVLCDLKMPKLSGLRVLEETRKISRSLPFVLMSAHATSDEVSLAQALGAFGFLAKPFSPDQLKSLLAEIEQGQTMIG